MREPPLILIVDDNRDNREILEARLASNRILQTRMRGNKNRRPKQIGPANQRMQPQTSPQ